MVKCILCLLLAMCSSQEIANISNIQLQNNILESLSAAVNESKLSLGLLSSLLPMEDIMEISNPRRRKSGSSNCVSTINEILQHFSKEENYDLLINLLAFSGKGINELGDYPGCKDSYISKYISFELQFDGRTMVQIGICGPAACTQEDYSKLTLPLFNLLNPILEPILKPFGIVLQPENLVFEDVQTRNEELTKFTPGAVIFIILCVMLLIFVVIASTTDYFINYKRSNINRNENKWHMSILYSFSFLSNAESILYSKNKGDKNLEALNGVRVLSMGWVILGHILGNTFGYPTINYTALTHLVTSSIGMSIFTAAVLAVDVFFALSAFLAVYSFLPILNNPNTPKSKIILILQGYLHRYIRLLPIYIVSILAAIYLLPILYDGPMTPFLSIFSSDCKHSWYLNLLYVNNIWAQRICMDWTWYIANDMQFFLIAPWISWFYLKSKSKALIILLLGFVGSAIIQSIVISYYEMGMSVFTEGDNFNEYYFKPWCRVNTYLLGIFFAWMYLSSKQEDLRYPAFTLIHKYLGVGWVRYSTFLFGVFLCTFCIFITSTFYIHPESKTMTDNIFYAIFRRPVFVFGLFLVIYPILLGYFCPLLSILGNQTFSALAKLTYGAYMLHILVDVFIGGSENQALYFTVEHIVFLTIDVFIFSYLLSFLLSVLIDSPVLRIEKRFLLPNRVPTKNIQTEVSSKVETPVLQMELAAMDPEGVGESEKKPLLLKLPNAEI